MTEAPPAAVVKFADAASRVIKRLWLRKSLQAMLRTLPLALGVLGILMVLRAIGFGWSHAWLASILLLLWITGSFASVWWRKPEPYAALAFWDHQTGHNDDFANAWWFEQQPDRNHDQQRHVDAQSALLASALPFLSRDIALPELSRLTLLPVLLLALVFIPGGRGLPLPDAALSPEGRRLAAEEGKRLAGKKLDADKMKALNENEKKELEKLQQKIAETVKSMDQPQMETARGVLSELEKRARDAEKLAEKLGAWNSAWASDQMVAEMRKHADTAELGDAVANKSTENTAQEAQKLSGLLRDEKLGTETRDRMTDTLREIWRQSQPEDAERVVGQHVLNADKDMAQSLPQEAGKEFQLLADKMRTMAARENARMELEKLAQQLRDAGSNAAGQGNNGMSQLAGNQGQGQGQQPIMMPNAPQMQSLQPPGMANSPQGQGQQGQGQNGPMLTPSPGAGQNNKNLSQVPQDGQPGKGKDNKPMLFAPVPAAQPSDQKPDSAIMVAVPGANPGGHSPGNGTAPLSAQQTEKTKPGRQSVVNAQHNAEGESSVRAVEGQTHKEAATRSAQTTALEAITAEENALDDAALPTARREQVRRYFTELRKRFEKEN